MKRLLGVFTISLICFLLTFSIGYATFQVAEFTPNDPKYNDSIIWARQLNLPKAWAEILRIEATTGPVAPEAIVLVLDTDANQ